MDVYGFSQLWSLRIWASVRDIYILYIYICQHPLPPPNEMESVSKVVHKWCKNRCTWSPSPPLNVVWFCLILFEYLWRGWIIWAWNQISDIWISRQFHVFLLYVESNLGRMEMFFCSMWNQILDDFNLEPPEWCVCFSFLRTCTNDCKNRWISVLDVCFAFHSHLGQCLFVFLLCCLVTKACADLDVIRCILLKYTEESEESR